MLTRPAILCSLALVAAMAGIATWQVAGAESATQAPSGAKPATPRDQPQPPDAKAAAPQRPYITETIQGQVVWLEDALKQGFGVTTEPASAESTVVVETSEGKLWPLVPDTRGRAFAVDERLRNRPLQLLVRRYEDVPMVQVIRVFERRDDGLYEIDYWCDICAIPMYILKPCECCQGETRLRETKVELP
ncbi:MAG: hypothetical protein WD845_06380 [Pirellulales bacterium]